VKKLLQKEQINTNWQDPRHLRTPFYIACRDGHIEIVKLLLSDSRVDINKGNYDDWTPFHSTCKNGHIEIVKLLLNEKRVDVNKATKDKATPFSIACWNGHIEIVKLLLESGKEIDIRKKDDKGKTGLDRAKEKGKKDIIKLIESFQKKIEDEKQNKIEEEKRKKDEPKSIFFFFLFHNNSK